MGGNQARARLLRVFVLDPERGFPIKDAAKRAGISERAAEKELKVLEKWGVVKKRSASNMAKMRKTYDPPRIARPIQKLRSDTPREGGRGGEREKGSLGIPFSPSPPFPF